ncbi:hypothetical protein EDC04DRAFT_3090877 [Pisolithus marmoratus]|nr:hypothetical protein EDC04DRAFT_3090877 [Pisolithus marmoratus]
MTSTMLIQRQLAENLQDVHSQYRAKQAKELRNHLGAPIVSLCIFHRKFQTRTTGHKLRTLLAAVMAAHKFFDIMWAKPSLTIASHVVGAGRLSGQTVTKRGNETVCRTRSIARHYTAWMHPIGEEDHLLVRSLVLESKVSVAKLWEASILVLSDREMEIFYGMCKDLRIYIHTIASPVGKLLAMSGLKSYRSGTPAPQYSLFLFTFVAAAPKRSGQRNTRLATSGFATRRIWRHKHFVICYAMVFITIRASSVAAPLRANLLLQAAGHSVTALRRPRGHIDGSTKNNVFPVSARHENFPLGENLGAFRGSAVKRKDTAPVAIRGGPPRRERILLNELVRNTLKITRPFNAPCDIFLGIVTSKKLAGSSHRNLCGGK